LNVARAFEHCDATVTITENAADALAASRLVVPGVGSFQHAINEMRNRGLDDAVKQFVLSGRPLFGICVGMQMLFDASEEFGEHAGLGILPGRVVRVPSATTQGNAQRVPHIGWSHLIPPSTERDWNNSLLKPYSGKNPAVYFVHSFAAQPENIADQLADCHYGGHRLCAAVQRYNLVATQFHPERSGEAGLVLLREFLDW
jgi:glutamine amidotransferase